MLLVSRRFAYATRIYLNNWKKKLIFKNKAIYTYISAKYNYQNEKKLKTKKAIYLL